MNNGKNNKVKNGLNRSRAINSNKKAQAPHVLHLLKGLENVKCRRCFFACARIKYVFIIAKILVPYGKYYILF